MILETNRTILREFAVSDAEEVLYVYSNPTVMKYIGDGSPFTLEQTRIFLGKLVNRYRTDGYGFWAVTDKNDNKIMGHCGLLQDHELNLPEIGYTIAETKWRLGYGFEVASAVMQLGFSQLGFSTIIAFAKHQNVASRKLMEKLGMAYWKDYNHNGRDCVVYKKCLAENM